jgi:hypothetical protein
MAPMVAMKIPPRSNDSTFPRPMKLPRKPPMIAPAMPIRIVTKIPPGSFPGMMNLARAPAMRPRRIHEKMPMPSFFRTIRRTRKKYLSISSLQRAPYSEEPKRSAMKRGPAVPGVGGPGANLF